MSTGHANPSDLHLMTIGLVVAALVGIALFALAG